MSFPKTWLVLAAMTVTAVAGAQSLDPFDAHCADIVVLQAKLVQNELGITQAQRDRLNVHAAEHKARLEAIQKSAQGTKKPVGPQVMQAFEILKTSILKELRPLQVRRLREITLQRVGLASLCDPVVAKRVGMSDAQLKKMQETYSEGARKYAAAEQNAIQPVLAQYKGLTPKTEAEAKRLQAEATGKLNAVKAKLAPQLASLRDTYDKRMRAILTSSQTNTYNALRGKAFKI